MTNIVLAVVLGIVIVTLTVTSVAGSGKYGEDHPLFYIVPIGTCIAGLAALILAAAGITIILGWGIAVAVIAFILAIAGGLAMNTLGDTVDGVATAGNFIAITIGALMMAL